MTSNRLNLKVKIEPNKLGTKEINIRSSLLVANLIGDIQDKFSLDGTLALYPEKADTPLNLNSPLIETGVEEGGTLVCRLVQADTGTADAIARGVRETYPEGFKRVYLEDERTTTAYDLEWQPAIIGRWDHRNPANNRLLAVDLEELEELPTVSRHHACITLDDGKFFIERLAARNPTYLDESQLRSGRKYPLEAGAKIQMGRVTLTFNVLS
jgi:hypothetical protein